MYSIESNCLNEHLDSLLFLCWGGLGPVMLVSHVGLDVLFLVLPLAEGTGFLERASWSQITAVLVLIQVGLSAAHLLTPGVGAFENAIQVTLLALAVKSPHVKLHAGPVAEHLSTAMSLTHDLLGILESKEIGQLRTRNPQSHYENAQSSVGIHNRMFRGHNRTIRPTHTHTKHSPSCQVTCSYLSACRNVLDASSG